MKQGVFLVLLGLAGCAGQQGEDASDDAVAVSPAVELAAGLPPATPIATTVIAPQPVLIPAPSGPARTESESSISPPALGTSVTAEQILDLPAEYYVVQLAAFREKTEVLAFIQQHGLGDPPYGRVMRNGEAWYVLLYGVWPSLSAAEVAVLGRPLSLQGISPWVRKLGDLQAAIRAVAEAEL